MNTCVRTLCILSIFCGAVLSLCPEGGPKQVLQILSSVVLLAVIVNGVKELDIQTYATELAKYREREQQLTTDGEELRDRLSRLVIEEEYRAYVESKAEALGVEAREIYIGTRWSTDGLWVPNMSRIQTGTREDAERLSGILLGELGIPEERQEWVLDD